MLRVILEPLIGDAPLVGGITFFFIRRPVSAYIYYWIKLLAYVYMYMRVCIIIIIVVFFSLQTLEINWTGATNLLDTPAFRLVSSFKKKSP